MLFYIQCELNYRLSEKKKERKRKKEESQKNVRFILSVCCSQKGNDCIKHQIREWSY